MTLLSLAVAFVLGVLVSLQVDIPTPVVLVWLGASALAGAAAAGLRWRLSLALLPLVLVLGMVRVELFESGPYSALASYHGRPGLQFEGTIAGGPGAAGPATRFHLDVDRVSAGEDMEAVSGAVQVTAFETSDLVRQREPPYYRYGDRLRLTGTLEPPPDLEDFDFPAYLASQGIHTVASFPEVSLIDEGGGHAFYRWLYATRGRLERSIDNVVPEPQASLGKALLLGLRDDLPDGMVDRFRRTGTSHVLAISGLHVGVLMAVTLALGRTLLGRRYHLYLLPPLIVVWLYALLSGMSPSVTRAAIMGTVYLAALSLGRPRSVLPALGLAAAVMVALSPNVLTGVSFQLSFAAMAGIALMAEPISRWTQRALEARLWTGGGLPGPIVAASDITGMTMAATLATLPLVAFYFESVSPAGIPTTLLVLPALPAVLVTQAAAALTGLVSVTAAEPIGWAAWLTSRYVTGVVGLAASVPGSSIETGRLSAWLAGAYYGGPALVYVFLRLRRLSRQSDGQSLAMPSFHMMESGVPVWALAPAVGLAALLWAAVVALPDDRLRVSFVDVGQGDGVFIAMPGGQQVIVDGGPDPVRMVQLVGERMPFQDRTIELVVLTHLHRDHVTGLVEVLRRYDVPVVLERSVELDSASYESWRKAVSDEGAEVVQAEAGQVIAFGGGSRIEVVSPGRRLLRGTASDVDNASVVVRLVHGDVSFLLTGDMFSEAEGRLVREEVPIESDVLKVGHHGSRTSSSPGFLERVNPSVAVISAGEDNRFGHPHAETLDALRRHVTQDQTFVTAERGTVELVTDGRRLELVTER